MKPRRDLAQRPQVWHRDAPPWQVGIAYGVAFQVVFASILMVTGEPFVDAVRAGAVAGAIFAALETAVERLRRQQSPDLTVRLLS